MEAAFAHPPKANQPNPCALCQVSYLGEERHTATLDRTLNPAWYETLSMPVCLPALPYAPEVVIGIYDKDAITEGT